MTKEKQFARAKAIAVLECMAIDLTGSLAGLKEANPMTEVLNQRLDAIDVAQEALREQPRWISVEERLPEDGVDVLTRRAVGMSVEAHCGWGWTEDGYHTKWRVTHWMPWPKPPGVEA